MTHKTIVAAALLMLSLSGAALAAGNAADPAEIKVLALATVTAADAVAAVETNSGGKVAELVLEDQNGKPEYRISVIKSDGSELTFLVDGMTGAVTATSDTQDTANAADAAETGESAGDQDSGNEDAN